MDLMSSTQNYRPAAQSGRMNWAVSAAKNVYVLFKI
jgi:hypothetical protein